MQHVALCACYVCPVLCLAAPELLSTVSCCLEQRTSAQTELGFSLHSELRGSKAICGHAIILYGACIISSLLRIRKQASCAGTAMRLPINLKGPRDPCEGKAAYLSRTWEPQNKWAIRLLALQIQVSALIHIPPCDSLRH